MVSITKINLVVYKPEDYKPIERQERKRITKLVMKRLFSLANRFDGASKVTITITAKGNA